jgi:hypothetical protein
MFHLYQLIIRPKVPALELSPLDTLTEHACGKLKGELSGEAMAHWRCHINTVAKYVMENNNNNNASGEGGANSPQPHDKKQPVPPRALC